MRRRDLFACVLAWAATPALRAAPAPNFAPVVPGAVLRFPDDEGAHPQFRTEWWYVTGWLNAARRPLGFQVTFFRTRPHAESANPSRFNPRHILIAHAAIADRAHGRLRHAQRSARAGFGLAEAREGQMDVHIDDWSLRTLEGHYRALLRARELALELDLRPTQPPLLHGQDGYSRKGPDPLSASYYYTLPQLRVAGRVRVEGGLEDVSGIAWLDHEWSSRQIDDAAVGWDWTGLNFDDGTAVMAFQMRGRDGSVHWAGGTIRTPDGATLTYAPEAIAWRVGRRWRSPRSGASYPVEVEVRIGPLRVRLTPLIDDQEIDTRISTGAIYWEGAVTAVAEDRRAARGYLELTGYAKPLRF